MQAAAALALPAPRHRDRIVAVDASPARSRLAEADALATPQVDRRNRAQQLSARRRAGAAGAEVLEDARARRAWLFSGWNWVANRLSRAIAATNSPP